MSFDKYSDKAAEAIALIREFAKVDEYWDYFKGDPEQALQAFCAMQDAAEEMGRMNERQACAARIEELEKQNASFAKWIRRRETDLPDHACAECVPYSDMLKEGFRCAFHIASTTEEKING